MLGVLERRLVSHSQRTTHELMLDAAMCPLNVEMRRSLLAETRVIVKAASARDLVKIGSEAAHSMCRTMWEDPSADRDRLLNTSKRLTSLCDGILGNAASVKGKQRHAEALREAVLAILTNDENFFPLSADIVGECQRLMENEVTQLALCN